MKFTIGIPAFKSKFLGECIESILKQEYNNFELIIINDASPYDIDGIVQLYNDERIVYTRNEINCGAIHVVDNWNKCLDMATGDYFILMGDDDKLAPNYLSEFSKTIKRYQDVNVFHCRTIIIDENSIPITITEPRPEFENMYDNMLQRFSGQRIQFISDFVYKTKFLKSIGGFYNLPLAWNTDELTAFIAAKDNGIVNINTPLFFYRRNRYNITSTGNIEQKMKSIEIERDCVSKLLEISSPKNEIETLQKRILVSNLYKFFQHKKINTLSAYLTVRTFIRFVHSLIKSRYYGMKIQEIAFTLLLSIKLKWRDKYYLNK